MDGFGARLHLADVVNCNKFYCNHLSGFSSAEIELTYLDWLKPSPLLQCCDVMLQAYENYSFEELRFASPTLRRPTENMLIRDNDDGSYTASWTPAASGVYHIRVKLDDFDAGRSLCLCSLLRSQSQWWWWWWWWSTELMLTERGLWRVMLCLIIIIN